MPTSCDGSIHPPPICNGDMKNSIGAPTVGTNIGVGLVWSIIDVGSVRQIFSEGQHVRIAT